MSLEVREMILRTTLTDADEANEEEVAVNEQSNAEFDAEYIIEQCIVRIMELIKEENEK